MEKDASNQTLSIDENLENPLVEKLREERLDAINTDFNINVHGKLFKCHRSTLTAASPFFESKLKSSKSKNEIDIDWHDVVTFESVLDYIYSGKIVLTKNNFDKILELSHLLSINKLKGYCEQYIESFINLNNCLKIKELSENFKLTKASEQCLNFINDNLMEVLALDEFLNLSTKNVELFFTDPATGCDNVPLIDLLGILSKWVKKDVEDRLMDYQKLLSILDWSNCSNDIFDYIKNEKLFEESKLCLYFLLSIMELNGIDLESYKSTHTELKKTYDGEDSKANKKETASTNTRSTRSSKRNVVATNDNMAIAIIEPVVNEEKRQGKRQIKRKFDSQEWIVENSSASTKKKRNQNSTSSIDKSIIDNETDRAVYMIKVNTSAENKSASVEKVINEVSLVAINEKESPTKSIASTSKSTSSSNNNQQQLTLLQLVDTQNNDSNQEFDESEYDIEENSDKELLSIKTEYCVRGKKHSATLAQWKEGVKCPKCTYVGHSAPRLEQHLAKVHQEDTTYTCKYCNFNCKWNREYYKHMKTHFKGPPYNCSECDYTCDRVQFILSHLMRHTDERPFACDQCDFRSRTKGNLVVHYRIHTGEKPYKCQHCDKKFAMKNTLDQHMATHRDDRPYLCDKCGFTTKYQSHLLSHKRIHTGNVFYCEQENCNYFSPRRSQLAAHTRSHLMIRSHVCDTCGRAFIERSHLIRHERIHLEEKPFKCEQCDYGSTRRDKLKEHVLKHHNQNGEKTFKPRKSKKNETASNSIVNSTNKQVSTQPQYQYVQQVHFENADQIPEEIQQQIIAAYQNQQINTENVSITIGENVYESQLIVNESELVVTPVNPNNQTKSSGGESSNQQPEIQITNVSSDQEIVHTDLVEFVLV